ncbi:hypothetical protein AWENTII_001146 [Aspergillus wentii]
MRWLGPISIQRYQVKRQRNDPEEVIRYQNIYSAGCPSINRELTQQANKTKQLKTITPPSTLNPNNELSKDLLECFQPVDVGDSGKSSSQSQKPSELAVIGSATRKCDLSVIEIWGNFSFFLHCTKREETGSREPQLIFCIIFKDIYTG